MQKETVMKKFILSFISPKEMVAHRDMNLFIAILIFIGCVALTISSSNIMSPSYVRKNHEELLIYDELTKIEDGFNLELYELKTFIPEKGLFKEITYDEEIDGKTQEITTALKDGTIVKALIVYDLNYIIEEGKKLNFDIEEYYRQLPVEGEKDLLFLVTKRYLIYVHNHGRFEDGQTYFDRAPAGKNIYITNDDGSIKYFLPLDIDEASGSRTNWTMEVKSDTLKDQNGNYYVEIENELYMAVPHIDWSKNENLAIQNNLYLDYAFLTDNGFSLNGFKGSVTDLSRNWYNFLIHIHASALKTANLINAILLMFIMPLFWIFVTWLMSKRFGELTLFREYYIISAVSMVLPSILAFIVGFFIPYYFFAKYLMFVHIAFYVYTIFKINSNAMRGQKNGGDTTKPQLPEKITTKQISNLADNNLNQIG